MKKHRTAKGLSPEKAAKAININVRYIRNLEKNNYKGLPADVYSMNILKSYARLLELNPATVLDIYTKEKQLYLRTQRRKTQTKVTKLTKLFNIFLDPRFIKYAIIVLILLGVFYYIGVSVNRIVSPPMLVIEAPEDNLVTQESQVTIKGQTEKEVNLFINNQPLLSDKDGNFTLSLDLQNKLNIIKISAQKKYSKEQVIYRRIYVEN